MGVGEQRVRFFCSLFYFLPHFPVQDGDRKGGKEGEKSWKVLTDVNLGSEPSVWSIHLNTRNPCSLVPFSGGNSLLGDPHYFVPTKHRFLLWVYHWSNFFKINGQMWNNRSKVMIIIMAPDKQYQNDNPYICLPT